MRIFAAAIAALAVVASPAQPEERKAMPAQASTPAGQDVQSVAPALERYTREGLLGDVWKRPGLTMRDRSIVTLAALIARNQTIEMPFYAGLALDSGVKPQEISEIITHLAFYSGWENAVSAAVAAKEVFAARKIGTDQLPAAQPKLLPLDEAAEADRAARVGGQYGEPSPVLCGTPPRSCLRTCGCVPTSRRAIAAL